MTTIAYQDVVHIVVSEVPEFRPAYDEHVSDHDEVLQHLLFGDLSRFTVTAYERGDLPLVGRIVSLMETLAQEGDELTTNLVAVSFVENIGPDDVDDEFFALYGPRLRDDLKAIWHIVPRG